MKSPLLRWCVVWLGLSLPGVSFANGGGYVSGVESTGAFKPLGIQQVAMLSEKLDIDLHIEHAEVRIEYVLHNAGPKVTVEAGFPSAVAWKRDLGPDSPPPTKQELSDAAALKEFHLLADGKALKTSVLQDSLKVASAASGYGSKVQAWHVFKLDFDKGQTRRLQVRYRNPYHGSFFSISDDVMRSPLTLTYLFSSAAAWKGTIEQGVVTVRAITANPDFIQFNHAKRFQREGNVWRWNFTDFEPTLEDDLVITTRPRSYGKVNYAEKSPGSDEWEYTEYVGWGGKRDHTAGAKLGGKWELYRYDYTAAASSTLAPQGKLRYDAALLASDKDDSSAWVEGAKGDGIGESVTLTLDRAANVRRVGLVNGYAKSEDSYRKNNRVSRLDVSVNGGKPFAVEVPDERLEEELFHFDLPEGTGPVKSVKLTIAAVHKGTTYEDTCLTKVALVVPLTKEPPLRPSR